MQFEAEGTNEAGYVDGLVPDVAADLAWGALESKQKVEGEIDLMLRTVRSFWELEPDQVAKLIQAMSARCTELCVHLHRLEGRREWKQVRTQQVERLLAELDRQWKLASRLIEVRRTSNLELMR
jgi:cytosine/adenosine deaminase-related metal-dependent hydrolase